MKESEFSLKLINLVRDHMVSAARDIVKSIVPSGQTSLLIDVERTEHIDNAYINTLVNDSGEYAYFRGEQVTGYILTAAGLSVKTECDAVIDAGELYVNELHGMISNLEEIRDRLADGTFTLDVNVLIPKYNEKDPRL